VIVLDTTVLAYAKGAGHPLREPCRELVDAIERDRLEATTTTEVIQEFLHVRARRRDRAEAADLAAGYADLLAPLLIVTSEQLARGIDLFKRSERLGAFDAVLAASAIDAGATTLVSADRAFGSVSGIDHVVPDAAGVAALLA
jgi:hypothetical protein